VPAALHSAIGGLSQSKASKYIILALPKAIKYINVFESDVKMRAKRTPEYIGWMDGWMDGQCKFLHKLTPKFRLM